MIDPCIPAGWPGFSVTLRNRSTRYDITVDNPSGVCRGIVALELDGLALDDLAGVPLADDRQNHQVRAVMGVAVPPGTAVPQQRRS